MDPFKVVIFFFTYNWGGKEPKIEEIQWWAPENFSSNPSRSPEEGPDLTKG